MIGGSSPGFPTLAEVLVAWDAVVIHWDLKGDEQSLLLGTGLRGPVDDAEAYRVSGVEHRMRLLVELAPIVANILRTQDRVRAWLRSANLNLGGRTPLETMAQSPEWIRWLSTSLGVGS